MTSTAAIASEVEAFRVGLIEIGDPQRATAQSAYMRDQFRFLGVSAADRHRLLRPLIAATGAAMGDVIVETAQTLWHFEEREFQLAATDLLKKRASRLDRSHLPAVLDLIVDGAWWDTVDVLAIHAVGAIISNNPEAVSAMDRAIDDPDIWVARTALLHQLRYGDRTDAARLFGFVDRRAADTEFFIRKASGWALRQYSRTDPDAVWQFVNERRHVLSGLTQREATRHLTDRRTPPS